MGFWTYILHCRGGAFYTGHTDDLEHRIAQHKAGEGAAFTRVYLPVELVWSQEFPSRTEAFDAERRIKGWSCFPMRIFVSPCPDRGSRVMCRAKKHHVRSP